MNLSDVNIAKHLFVRLSIDGDMSGLEEGNLLNIEEVDDHNEFIVNQYGDTVSGEKQNYLAKTDFKNAKYIHEILENERNGHNKNLFLIDSIDEKSIIIQHYLFSTITSYRTTVYIQVPEKVLEKSSAEKLAKDYIWNGLGEPALFCLNYKQKAKDRANIRFLAKGKFLVADNTSRGIVVTSESYLKKGYDVMVDIYLAPKIVFIPETNQAKVNKDLESYIENGSASSAYMRRWDIYNALNKMQMEKESSDFGEIPYTSVRLETELNGTVFDFEVSDTVDQGFINKEIGLLGEVQNIIPGKEELAYYPIVMGLGRIIKIQKNRIVSFLENAEDIVSISDIPKKGQLGLYSQGDRAVLRRREDAKQRINTGNSAIPYLANLVEAGLSPRDLDSYWGSHKGVTNKLKKDLPMSEKMNPRQIDALVTALNTPDISIIQGPPGTGKTTVIKAICDRFREIYENEQNIEKKKNPEYVTQSPSILISSFQNDAVDNAISSPLAGDVPAYRKLSSMTKTKSNEQYQKSVDSWFENLRNCVEGNIKSDVANIFVEEKRKLYDEFLDYKNTGEDINKAIKLFEHYLSFVDIDYPEALKDKVKRIIAKSKKDSIEVDDQDPIVKKIVSQRVDELSFGDDGQIQAQRLLIHINNRDELNISNHIVDAIEKVCDDDYTDDEFKEYVSVIEELKSLFCKKQTKIDINDKRFIEGCILELSGIYEGHYVNQLDDIESKKTIILSDFLQRMEQEYDELVKKYSMTVAATCQASYDNWNPNKIFDLVIIDEAARANPLDLFIPMAMGKKVVLVGDQNQLPHMLEQDVLDALKQEVGYKDIDEYEISLFERLFDMFERGAHKKSVFLNQQYRMHPDICEYVSSQFYEGKLNSGNAEDEERLRKLRTSPATINDGRALTVVNISRSNGAETSGISKCRAVEAETIANDVIKILNEEPNATIGIITFYQAQVTLLKNYLEARLDEEQKDQIEIGTVDAFQGKEFEYVLLSCVRSNNPDSSKGLHKVGFLSKPNRLNVAFSRAQKQLAVYGDFDTLVDIEYFTRLYEICLSGGGCYRES